MPTLSTPEGKAVNVAPVELSPEQLASLEGFNRAQTDAPEPTDVPAPPKRQVPDKTDPGYTPNVEKPKRGRPRKEDAARTTKEPAKDSKPLPPKDFTPELNVIGDSVWLGASQVKQIAPYAAVIHSAQPAIVSALNAGAQVNPGLRAKIEASTSGAGNAWMLQLAVVGVQVGLTMMKVARDPELRAQLVEVNSQNVNAYVSALSGEQAGE